MGVGQIRDMEGKMDKDAGQVDSGRRVTKIKSKTKNKPKTEKVENQTKNKSKKEWKQR